MWQESTNNLFGTTNNPYNTTRNVGGSSGGEASLIAAGGTPLSIGMEKFYRSFWLAIYLFYYLFLPVYIRRSDSN